MKRREMLNLMGLAAGASIVGPSIARASDALQETAPNVIDYVKPDRPVTAIVLGAGNRGVKYANYATTYPDEFKIVGAAEPIPWRNERIAVAHNIPEQNRFVTWEDVFKREKFADAVIITTLDAMHYGPAMAALEKGYHLLLEKAIAQTWKECKDILELARKKDRMVATCHVLRYTPYFRQMKHIIASGQIGDIVHVNHLEPTGHIHFSHSFVRGPWRNTAESNPTILSKSCHDLDLLHWMIDKPCTRLSSFGNLNLFKSELAPSGAADRCTNCKIESTCAFSAQRIYLREKLWNTHHLEIEFPNPDTIRKALEDGPFGRCVWQCDNDVADNQVVNMLFDDQITVNFSMVAETSYGGRRTRVMGTRGDIVGDGETITTFDFAKREQVQWSAERAGIEITSGHGGGDFGIVRDFVQGVSREDPSLISTTIEDSMPSHYLGFKAEESRHAGGRSLKIRMPG